MGNRGRILLCTMAALLQGGCVAAVVGHAPRSGSAADPRGRAPPQSDATVGAAVRARLRGDAALQGAAIAASVQRGNVTLRGAVGSEAQRSAASRAALAVDGVVTVDNQLELR